MHDTVSVTYWRYLMPAWRSEWYNTPSNTPGCNPDALAEACSMHNLRLQRRTLLCHHSYGYEGMFLSTQHG